MLESPLRVVKGSLREYVALNILYYGLVAIFMVYSVLNPVVQEALMEELREAFLTTYPSVVEAYTGGDFLLASALTFSVNLALGSFVSITAPSLVIPFGGVAVGLVRAALWGLVLAPTTPGMALAMIPHSLTLVLEGQGYILAMFAAYIQWKGVFKPKSVGEEGRRKAYLAGLRKTGQLYLLVTAILAVSALYEAFEVIYIIGRLGR